MKKVVEFLQANPVQYLATVGRDGKAKCRPFMFSGEMDGKLWFCTNNTKAVYKDMQRTRRLRFLFPVRPTHGSACTARQCLKTTWLSRKCALQNPIVKSQYQTAENPIFEVFYLEDAHGLIADFSGNPARTNSKRNGLKFWQTKSLETGRELLRNSKK